jgi:23S rRNA (cytidine2498-2'-O)-methyltransferase
MIPKQIVILSKEFQTELRHELKYHGAKVLHSTSSALWIEADIGFEPAWADCVWRDVKGLEFDSITDAQKKLRTISPRWRYYGDLLNRRGALIAEPLTGRKKQELFQFPGTLPYSSHPVFTLADQNLILYSHSISRPTVDGVIPFKENKKTPPSRAYLKLWEALTLLGEWPKLGECVVDLGSSPGSWTWALSELQANVLSLDRADLDEKVMRSRWIDFRRGDAFSFQPTPMDWVFSDVICFPEKLLEYVQTWLNSGHCEQFVCNIKLTGESDPSVIEKFQKIPHSRVLHVLNGKHELTWIRHPKIK